MADRTSEPQAPRSSLEGLIALAAPFLDVLLGVGERISRIAEPTDYEYYPIQPGEAPARLPEASGSRAGAGAATVDDDGTILSTAEEIGPDEDAAR